MKIHAAALLLIFATACASSKSSTPSSASAATPPSSSEIIRDVEDASATLKKTLTSLEIVVEGRSDVLKARDAYFTDLADLDRKIETVRDHAADLARRRDAFLKDWLDRTSQVEKASMREAAEKRRTELQVEFMALATKGRAARQALAPMFGALKDCAKILDADSSAATAKSLAPEYESIRTMEAEVTRTVGEYRAQLQKIAAMLGATK